MKIFLFYFEMAIKITGSAQNYRVGRVSGNTPIFLGLMSLTIITTSLFRLDIKMVFQSRYEYYIMSCLYKIIQAESQSVYVIVHNVNI